MPNQNNLVQAEDLAKALKRRESRWGALEGLAMGAVLGFFTGGIGWVMIPICMAWRVFDRLNKANSLVQKIDNHGKISLMGVVKGAGLGAAVGASIGLMLAGFTFGLSIPIGAAVGFLYGLVDAGLNEYVSGKLFSGKLSKKEVGLYMVANQGAFLGSLGGAALGLGLLLAPFTAGISLIPSIAIVAGSALVGGLSGYGISKGLSSHFSAQHAGSSLVAASLGSLSGLAAGAMIGVFFAPITFGLSVPICALIGAFAGGSILGIAERAFGLSKKVTSILSDDNGTLEFLRRDEETSVVSIYNGSSTSRISEEIGPPPSVLRVDSIVEQYNNDNRLLEASRTPTSSHAPSNRR